VTTINQTQRDTWNGDSHRWVADADRRDAVLAPIADTLLAAAHIQPGESVLDLGCGCGATTITAATHAGPGGTAHGIDLSEPMLAVARHRAPTPGSPPCPSPRPTPRHTASRRPA
jgi:cyclopropane fatty-acyl-phospholipid synthase-like methyltransferase